MGAFATGAWMGGRGYADIGNVLHRGGSVSDFLPVRVMIHVHADWEDSGSILPSGEIADDGVDVTEERGQGMYLPPPPPGGGNGGRRNVGGGYLCIPS